MKRMNVNVDEVVLKEAMIELGEFTASGAINHALREIIRVMRVRKGIQAISGTGAWQGDLQQMRATRFEYPIDAPQPKRKVAAKTVTISRRKKSRGSRSSR